MRLRKKSSEEWEKRFAFNRRLSYKRYIECKMLDEVLEAEDKTITENFNVWSKGSIYPLKRYKSIFEEKPFDPSKYSAILRSEFRKAFIDTKDARWPNITYLLEILNNRFQKYNVRFLFANSMPQEDEEQVGFDEARTNPTTGEILFFCNHLFLSSFKIKFAKVELTFTYLLEHELIHRWQIIRNKQTDLQKKMSSQKDAERIRNLPPEEKQPAYFSLYREIMSYAWNAVEEMRFNGYSNERIVDFIRSIQFKKEDIDYFDISPVFNAYYQEFVYKSVLSNSLSVFKKFLRYMYDYAVGNIHVHEDQLLTAK